MLMPNGVINILSVLVNALPNGTQRANIKIEGALQQFEISQSFECGHSVYFEVFSCKCNCYGPRTVITSLEHPSNYSELCTRNHLCFTISGKQLFIKEKKCPAYGICSLRFSPIHIYQLVQLKNSKTFNILKLNGNENILLPTKYTSLVDKNNEFKMNCMNKMDYPRTNQPGWYFWLKVKRETIFKTKFPHFLNNAKAVDGEKYCWYQFGNEEALKMKITSLDLLGHEVCNGNNYDWNVNRHVFTGLHPKGSVLDENDKLPGIEVEARSVTFSDQVAQFYYSCKVMSFEYESNFIPWFGGIYRKDDEIYLKTNLNVTTGPHEASIAVWDQSGHEIMKEKTVALGKFVALSLHKAFSDFAGNKTLVCISVDQLGNWCERLDIKIATESEMQEYYDYFLISSSKSPSTKSTSTSSPTKSTSTSPSPPTSSSTKSTSTLPSPSTLTPTIVTSKGSEDENPSESDLINSTLNDDLGGNTNSTVWILLLVACLVLVIVIGTTTYYWRKRWKGGKNGNFVQEDKDSFEKVPLKNLIPESISESIPEPIPESTVEPIARSKHSFEKVPLKNLIPESIPESIIEPIPEPIPGSTIEPISRPKREPKIEIKNSKVDSINYYYYTHHNNNLTAGGVIHQHT